MKIKQILYLMSFCLLLSATTFAQQVQEFTVSGTVVDKDKLSMPGVSVYIKDKPSKGTTTDNDGNFKLKVVYGDKMIFSFIGFKPSEHVAIKPQTDLTVTLLEDNNSLDEVVVVALGNVQRKISSVGAITTVSTKDIQSPSPSISNLLGGRAAGVISLQSSGEPGQNIADFWVRGIGTFGANSSALVLIDGLEGDLNTIDPADVESFSILKDASATAVYGVRGANGVVLVNTKKGLSGKIQITGRFNTTLSVLNRLPEYLGAYEYAQLANEARAVRNETPLYDDTEMGIIRDGLDPDLYPNVNWQDEILNKTFWRHTYYVSGRGGSDVARYFLSLGGKNESAAYKVDKNSIYSSNVSYNTYNYRINLDVNLTKSTKVYLGSDGFLSQLNQPGVANTEYIWGAQSRLTPLSIPTQYSNGMLPGRGAGELSSPYVMINHTGKAANEVYKGKSTLAINQDFSELINGLKLRVQERTISTATSMNGEACSRPSTMHWAEQATDHSSCRRPYRRKKPRTASPPASTANTTLRLRSIMTGSSVQITGHPRWSIITSAIPKTRTTPQATYRPFPCAIREYPAGLLMATRILTCWTSTSDTPVPKTSSPADNTVSSRPSHWVGCLPATSLYKRRSPGSTILK